jgi:hypothetical protein
VSPRTIHANIVGWSSSDTATRCIGYGAPAPNFLRRWIDATAAAQRAANPMLPLFIWNYFGCLPYENMQFSQAIQAERAGLAWLFDGFDRTVHDLAHNGGELTFYLGGEPGDRIIKSHYANSTKDRLIKEATRHLPRCVGIAVDGSSGLKSDSRVYRWMCAEQDAGRKVYAEALPLNESTHLHRFPAIATRWFLSHPERAAWGANVPEVIEVAMDAPLTQADIDAAHAQGRSIAGHTPIVASAALRLNGVGL